MPNISFHPFPDLNTERLHLRQLTIADDEDMLQLRDHPEVLKYIDRPKAASPAGARDFIHYINQGIARKRWLYWGITLSGHTQIIGTVCLWHFNPEQTQAELGYELHPKAQGKGMMREAVKTVINYAFDGLPLQKIDAYTHFKNVASAKLLKKCGFSYNGESEQFNLFQLGNEGYLRNEK